MLTFRPSPLYWSRCSGQEARVKYQASVWYNRLMPRALIRTELEQALAGRHAPDFRMPAGPPVETVPAESWKAIASPVNFDAAGSPKSRERIRRGGPA